MYINTQTNEYPLRESDIREAHPNVSFPTPFRPIEPYRFVTKMPKPSHNPVIEKVVELSPQYNESEGVWEQVFDVVTKFEEYTDEENVTHTVEDQIQAAIEAQQAKLASSVQTIIVDAVQARLDAFARTRNYDNILFACTYATSTVPKFQTEGQYAVELRDETWAVLYSILDDVLAGELPMPESYDDVEPMLPVMEWPAPPSE